MIIAVDAACRGNGKVDCVSAGCAFVKMSDQKMYIKLGIDTNSTNQRGELLGLSLGLAEGIKNITERKENVYLITDSEYIYNTITKEWYETWMKRGWVTAAGEPVKNQDMWTKIISLLHQYEEGSLAVYHVKGHVFSMGKVTASNIIKSDVTCKTLYEALLAKLFADKGTVKVINNLEHAIEVFYRNHGYQPPMDKFNEMIVCNTVADIVASDYLSTQK